MSVPSSIVQAVVYGREFHPSAPGCMYLFDQWKDRIFPRDFRPLIRIAGGFSVIELNSEETKSGDSLIIANDWLNRCREAGAGVSKAILALAANHDDHAGMVALALETASVAMKPETPKSLKLDFEGYYKIVAKLYLADVAGIQTLMKKDWCVATREGANLPPKLKMRSAWRMELGHDVLIHPANLKPCRDAKSVLEYLGVEAVENGERFLFRRPGAKRILKFKGFPPLP